MNIGSRAIRLRFFKVAPGAEFSSDSEPGGSFFDALQSHGLLGSAGRAYKTLGSYDAAVIEEVNDYQDGQDIPFPLPGTKHAHNVLCFQLDGPTTNFLSELPPIISISFLKLNRDGLRRDAAAFHDAAVAILHDARFGSARTVAILGSFGWHELVLLVGGDLFSDVLHLIFQLRRSHYREWGINFFEATHTVPGLSYDRFHDQTLPNDNDEMYATVLVEVRPGSEPNVSQMISSYQKGLAPNKVLVPQVIYGQYDIKVDFGKAHLKTVFDFVKQLRLTLRGA